MATILTLPTTNTAGLKQNSRFGHFGGVALATILTPFALAIHGYHPYAEDGGVYLAGVKKMLHPELFPYWSEFVTEHLRFSLFGPAVVGLVHISRLSLMTVWLLLYVASFWLTLFAGWMVAERCYRSELARSGAVVLLALWLTMPVAGTALMLMDPYLSARSFSTPLTLIAIAGILDLTAPAATDQTRKVAIILCVGTLFAAALIHPLMAAYGLGFIVLLVCARSSDKIRLARTVVIGLAGTVIAGILFATASPESTAYRTVAQTRTYWFIAHWRWYEQFGLIAPLVILLAVSLQRQTFVNAEARAIARAGIASGLVAIVIAAVFSRTEAATYIVARLQPLRIFQIIYSLMIMALGAHLGESLLRQKKSRWAAIILVLATLTLFIERSTFPNSSHFESPWQQPQNGWQKAFEWIRNNIPTDALFALDTNYVSQAGEDAQTFRATAERSALADYSKDGGETSITPELTEAWSKSQAAQTGLNAQTDSARIAALRKFGVSWLVLPTNSATSFDCAYNNGTVKVCRLPN